jgi:hypothetical protein
MEIRLFKTTVQNTQQVLTLKPQLNLILKSIKWNFDLNDCDSVLRIEGVNIPLRELIFIMKENNQTLVELH